MLISLYNSYGDCFMLALLLTLISGLFFLIGIIIYRFIKHKNELTVGAMACAMIVIVGLIIFDLVPELIEIKKWYLIIFVVLGLIILLLIDKLVPHHHHEHHEHDENTKGHQEHIRHIGFITILALLLHNIVEGMALYSVANNNFASGVLMCLGISLHNLPFGFQIANYSNKAANKIAVLFLVVSGLIGGILIYLFGDISEMFTGIIVALTLGMILYILIFELLGEVLSNIKKKATICGIIIGILILIFINLI